MRSSFSDRYINRTSATVLALTKLPEGLFAGFVLYHLIKLLAPAVKEMSKGTVTLTELTAQACKEFGYEISKINELMHELQADEAIAAFALPWIVVIVLLAVLVVGLILTIAETIALLALRFAKAGASVIKVIHWLNLVVCVLNLGIFLYSSIQGFRNLSDFKRRNLIEEAAWPVFVAALVVICIICIIILMMHLCYHKDVAMAMQTVSEEVYSGKPERLSRTHLSGISFWFALAYILCIVSVFASSREAEGSGISKETIVFIGIYVINVLKYFSVCFCNRNLKRARGV